MSIAAILGLLIKAIPAVLRLANSIVQAANDRRLIKAGEAQAIAAQLTRLTWVMALAMDAAREAEAAHRADPTDGAFDQEFKRGDGK